jgi:nicotinate-nucleotide adenylyltransferase
MKQVGVFAGTFDPIHEGHLAFAGQAIKQCGLDKVFFLVEPRPRRKQGVRALEHREAMVRLAIEGRDEFGIIMLEQANFSVEETLPKLRALFEGAEIHFLMGEDIVMHLNDWPHVEDLLDSSSFILGVREGDAKKVETVLESIKRARGISFPIKLITTDEYAVSSSKIRLAYKKGIQPLGISEKVAGYIEANKLYAPNEE